MVANENSLHARFDDFLVLMLQRNVQQGKHNSGPAMTT
jgi:hypothetical protein